MARAEKRTPAKADRVNALAAPGALESGEQVENWANKKDSQAYDEAGKLYPLITKAYEDKQDQSDKIVEYWAIYTATPDSNQQYSGNSQCYVPAVRDCINARTKRALKQLFPSKYRHVEAVGGDEEKPYPVLALLEHYIRKTKLKDIVRSDLAAGDVTGQWNLYIDWTRSYRRITEAVRQNPALESEDGEPVELVDPTEEEDAIEETDILEEGPEIVDFATEDLAVVPPTCNDIEAAQAVALRLRMSKERVKELVDEGVFVLPDGENPAQLWERLEKEAGETGTLGARNPAKRRSAEAGIKTDGTYKYLLCFETTAQLTFEEEGGEKVKRLAYIYYASASCILGIVKAPQWGGKRPVLSAPVERVRGSFFGRSKIEAVKFLQWNLNDYWNMGQDSAMYSLLPIVMTDPLANPNFASMVMGLSAVWAVDPNKTKFANMPQLYKDALPLCDAIKKQIWESMDVNEVMLGNVPSGRKNNAVMGAVQQEQMLNIMDHAERYEESMLTPLAERMFEYDQQFRTASLTVLTKGQIGVKAKMQTIEPQQFGERYRFQWAGTSIVSGQQVQQSRIAGLNVLRGIPPQQLNGRRVDITPVIEEFVEELYGPELGPLVLIDERNLYTVPPDVENEMMHNNLPTDVHEADNHQMHLVSHMSAARMTGDPEGRMRAHIAKHTMAMQQQVQKSIASQQGGEPGMPGQVPPGPGGPPGVAGTPRIGAMPQGPRAGPQGPAGMIHPDQLIGGQGRG